MATRRMNLPKKTRRMKAAVTVSLKLLIDTHAKRVLFAEAGEDFVDFLRYLLALPVGTMIRILNNRSMLGSLGEDLFSGIENQSLSDFYPPYFRSAAKKPSSTCFYMVMDDLTVKPMSTTLSSFALLNEFDGKEAGPIEERVVDVRLAEGLKLAKASLQSNMVLTSVFLGDRGHRMDA
ncbi:hypothetical protein RHGRI_027488 [Rhododendron griersonianum]|uniref:Uncharacterized protein n=1 Tax=Rhododendron griersonianum TaxID=479676 RepID=A0AAV6IYF3_9ERIC|nr:hypothetical protein RHGRI_027488 [Rhododendron griersonianum]